MISIHTIVGMGWTQHGAQANQRFQSEEFRPDNWRINDGRATLLRQKNGAKALHKVETGLA
jgi:hypothetical protein